MEKTERKIVLSVVVAYTVIVLTVGVVLGAAIKPRARDGDRMRVTECRSGYEVILDTYAGVSYLVVGGEVKVLVQHDGTPYVENGFRDWEGE